MAPADAALHLQQRLQVENLCNYRADLSALSTLTAKFCCAFILHAKPQWVLKDRGGQSSLIKVFFSNRSQSKEKKPHPSNLNNFPTCGELSLWKGWPVGEPRSMTIPFSSGTDHYSRMAPGLRLQQMERAQLSLGTCSGGKVRALCPLHSPCLWYCIPLLLGTVWGIPQETGWVLQESLHPRSGKIILSFCMDSLDLNNNLGIMEILWREWFNNSLQYHSCQC